MNLFKKYVLELIKYIYLYIINILIFLGWK